MILKTGLTCLFLCPNIKIFHKIYKNLIPDKFLQKKTIDISTYG